MPTGEDKSSRWEIVQYWAIRFCECNNRSELLDVGMQLALDRSVPQILKDSLRYQYQFVLRNF